MIYYFSFLTKYSFFQDLDANVGFVFLARFSGKIHVTKKILREIGKSMKF